MIALTAASSDRARCRVGVGLPGERVGHIELLLVDEVRLGLVDLGLQQAEPEGGSGKSTITRITTHLRRHKTLR